MIGCWFTLGLLRGGHQHFYSVLLLAFPPWSPRGCCSPTVKAGGREGKDRGTSFSRTPQPPFAFASLARTESHSHPYLQGRRRMNFAHVTSTVVAGKGGPGGWAWLLGSHALPTWGICVWLTIQSMGGTALTGCIPKATIKCKYPQMLGG